MRRSLALLGLVPALVLASLASVACGGGDASAPPPNTGGPAPTANPPPPGPGPGPTAAPTQTVPTSSAPPLPTFAPLPTSTPPSGGGTAQPLDPTVAAAATAALAPVAASEAPGMTKDGPTVAGTFQEGQTLEGTFTFQPGKCYTLVAAGAGPSQIELEMQYVTPIPGLSPSIGKSGGSGAVAAIGAKSACLRPMSPIAAPAKFIVRASKGAGLVAAQLYSK